MKTNETPTPISRLIEEEYITHKDGDSEEVWWTKEALARLTKFQRQILITYLELGSYTKAARAYHVCVPTIREYVNGLMDQVRDFVCSNMAGPTSTDAGDEKA